MYSIYFSKAYEVKRKFAFHYTVLQTVLSKVLLSGCKFPCPLKAILEMQFAKSSHDTPSNILKVESASANCSVMS